MSDCLISAHFKKSRNQQNKAPAKITVIYKKKNWQFILKPILTISNSAESAGLFDLVTPECVPCFQLSIRLTFISPIANVKSILPNSGCTKKNHL